MSETRTMLVPDGLEGERVDAAIARLFGLSRTRAADLAAAGEVRVEHREVGKSHRVSAGDLLEISLPSAAASPTLAVVAEPVPGMIGEARARIAAAAIQAEKKLPHDASAAALPQG